jgi:hypothetical protein
LNENLTTPCLHITFPASATPALPCADGTRFDLNTLLTGPCLITTHSSVRSHTLLIWARSSSKSNHPYLYTPDPRYQTPRCKPLKSLLYSLASTHALSGTLICTYPFPARPSFWLLPSNGSPGCTNISRQIIMRNAQRFGPAHNCAAGCSRRGHDSIQAYKPTDTHAVAPEYTYS